MLVCYLCGTQHGLSSLVIHQKQCAVKREKSQATLAPGDRTEAPNPNPTPLPETQVSLGGSTRTQRPHTRTKSQHGSSGSLQ